MKREYIGTILSMIGMVLNVVAFHARKKRTLLILHFIATCFHMCSYIFSGGGMGIWLNMVFLARSALFLKTENSPRKDRLKVYYLICAGCVIAYAAFTLAAKPPLADCLWNLIPIIGAFFGTYAFVHTDMVKLRYVKMVDSVSWLLFNGHVGIGALGGFLGEVFNIISMLLAIRREKKEAAAAA